MSGSYPNRIKRLPLYDGRFDAYKLEAKGSDVLFASYPAGTTIPAHVHETDNYGVITKGELILSMNGVVQRFGVGNWYHVPAYTEHAASFEQDTDEIEFWFNLGEKG
ncbi:cupin domain-containing protein [Microbulbifer variabilis]|uniref:cupin domain-containing protein n=1 Tax=Microbulbifer variabilis TaxID=266805 RepID=UPI001CFC8622|nr:cupin domain-containing protein [Microbulbifer variabilis]